MIVFDSAFVIDVNKNNPNKGFYVVHTYVWRKLCFITGKSFYVVNNIKDLMNEFLF